MALLKAAVLIYLAIVPLVSPLPVPQTAENKGRGRSYPLIISQYSNVRNSKFDSPPATEAPAPIVEPDSAVSTKVEDAVQPASDADIDTEDAVADAKKVIEIKTEEVKSEQVKSDVESETEQKKVVEEDNKKTVAADEVIEKTEKTVESEQPSAVADAPNKESTTGDSKNESILAASDASDASIVEPLKTASPSIETPAKTEESAAPSAESDSTKPIVESTGSASQAEPVETLKNTKEETPVTSLTEENSKAEEAVAPAPVTAEADKPAALDDKRAPEMEATASVAADSGTGDSKPEEAAAAAPAAAEVAPAPTASDAPKEDDKVIAPEEETKSAVTVEEKKTPAAEEPINVETSRTADLKPTDTKTNSEFFEEDRSFKDRPEDLILEAIRQGALDEKKLLETKNLDVLHANSDDAANEGIRLERDDKKSDKKEKFTSKPSLKEKKPIKPIVSDDPVQEYEDPIRGGRANEESQSNAEAVEKTAEEAEVISLVPSNYPVILPNGESTLSDKVKPEDTESPKVETKAE